MLISNITRKPEENKSVFTMTNSRKETKIAKLNIKMKIPKTAIMFFINLISQIPSPAGT